MPPSLWLYLLRTRLRLVPEWARRRPFRAGRWAAKDVCTGHAEKFAAKNEVEITDAPPQEHASQQAIRAAFGTAATAAGEE